jgi:hypothetical protein
MEAKITDTVTLYLEIITIQTFKRLTGLTTYKNMTWPYFTIMKIIPCQCENDAVMAM